MAYIDSNLNDPSLFFNTITYSGNGSNPRTLTGVGFQPDWVWLKNRTDANGHTLADSVRGANKTLSSDGTGAEVTDKSDGHLDAFTSDGFTVGAGSSSDARVNDGSHTYVAWNWKESTTAGFDIVSYTGNGSAGNTVSHSLSAVPHVMIVKNRESVESWMVYHHKNTAAPETDYLEMDTNGASVDNSNRWNDTAPTSSVFTVGDHGGVNESSADLIAYLFAPKQGFSKFGSYTGNGNADGTFVYTGFRPAWVMIKQSDGANGWNIYDNKRNTFNVMDKFLLANSSQAEASYSVIDFLSNGIKLRNTASSFNTSGASYIYMAFAEAPFVNSNGVPCNAR